MRSRRHTSKPSMSGRPRSRVTRSGWCSCTRASPSRPDAAPRTSRPRCSSTVEMSNRMSSSSSMTTARPVLLSGIDPSSPAVRALARNDSRLTMIVVVAASSVEVWRAFSSPQSTGFSTGVANALPQRHLRESLLSGPDVHTLGITLWTGLQHGLPTGCGQGGGEPWTTPLTRGQDGRPCGRSVDKKTASPGGSGSPETASTDPPQPGARTDLLGCQLSTPSTRPMTTMRELHPLSRPAY